MRPRDIDKVNYCKDRVIQAFLAECERAESAGEPGVSFRVPERDTCAGVMDSGDLMSIRDLVPMRYRPDLQYKKGGHYLFRVPRKVFAKEAVAQDDYKGANFTQEMCWGACAASAIGIYTIALILTG